MWYRTKVSLFFILFPFLMYFQAALQGGMDQEDKTVLIAILARDKGHALPKYLRCIENLDYNKKLITIYINTNNNSDNTEQVLLNWAKANETKYHHIVFESHEVEGSSNTRPHEWTAERFKILGAIRNKSMRQALEYNCDYYFVIDCDNFITPCTLKELVNKKKPIIAPMLLPKGVYNDPYSNYFCDILPNGYFQDHENYMKIFKREMVGTFKVPVVHCTYLIQSDYIDKLTYVDDTFDYEFVVFSRSARANGVDQYICNEKDFGWLLHYYEDLTAEEEARKFKDLLNTP